MTSITSALAGNFYQLNNSSSGASKSTGGSGLAAALNALDNANNPQGTTPTTNNAFSLDLSESAKAYLAGLQNNTSTDTSGNSTFLLSFKQRDALNAIISSYADKPLTEENYQALQKDLDAAGLAPDQLAMRDQLRNLNPTRIFLDALNGADTGQQPNFGEMTDAQKSQANGYMQSIVKQWQAIAPAEDEGADPVG